MTRLVSAEAGPPEPGDRALRPQTLSEFVGQAAAKSNLSVFIDAARGRGEAMDHVLLFGPPGLGKTTLAQIIARELGVNFRATSGPVLAKAGDLAAILTNLEPRDVLFIDEIHRLHTVIEEILYPAMEDFFIDVIIGEGPSARSIKITLEPFTLVGATTRIGLLGSPFRDRFGLISRLSLYGHEDLARIIERSAAIMGIPILPDGSMEIARRSRGTPRIANRLLRRVGDYALVRGGGVVDRDVADRALCMLGVDSLGLDELDRRIIQVIVQEFGGGPVGVKTIAIAVGEDTRTIEEVHEPYLIQAGFIKRTPQGREATPAARGHLTRQWW